MERALHRKSKSASGIEDISLTHQQKSAPRLSSDARCRISGSNKDYMPLQFIPELGQSFLGRANGTSMKKLLAEEMSIETESKRQSSNIIAKLMGLEGQPSPQHVHRQHKTLSDSCQQKISPNNKQRHRQKHDRRSSKKSSVEQQEFRDVYEDVEASHIVNLRCSSRWSASSNLTKSEMSFISHKFIDLKHFSADENLQHSEEVDDTSDLLDSNKELLLKYLQKPIPLFVKHLHDPQISHGRHIAVLMPSSSAKYEDKAKAWKSESDTSCNLVMNRHLKREDGLLLAPHNRHRAYISPSSPEMELQERNEAMILPTRIVVLKPNLDKTQDAGKSSSSSDPSHGYLPNFSKLKEYSSVGGVKTVSWHSKDVPHYDELPNIPMSKGAREIARDITRRMRVSCDETMDPKSSGFRGYAGDESSSDSDSETDKFKLFSQSSSRVNKLCLYPSPSLSESSVNKEAKKRLSERWKVTQRYQDVELVGKGRTLGEMLAVPDRETGPKHLNATSGGECNLFGSNNGTAMWDNPLGISSSDGWKNIINSTPYRTRSFHPSMGGRSYKRSRYHEKLAGDKHLMHDETVCHGRSKVVKGNQSRVEKNSSKESKLLSKKNLPRQNLFVNKIDASAEANFEIQMEANIKELSGQQPMFQMEGVDEICRSTVSDNLTRDVHGHGGRISLESSESCTKKSVSIVDKDASDVHDQHGSTLQELHKGPPEQGSPSSRCLVTELDSSESSKEADHPSPVSVLQVPFAEDIASSSKSFERVRAELDELRMQLQLLKMESGENSEASLIPIDEEISELSPIFSEKSSVLEKEDWEVSYALDVLDKCSIEETGLDTLTKKALCSVFPLDPGLFDDLEKKYGDMTTCSRPERRLLFDMINAVLFQFFQQQLDLFTWLMPKLGKLHFIDAIVELINQDLAIGNFSERALDREMLWSGSKQEVELIVNEVEKLLISDMISDVLCT